MGTYTQWGIKAEVAIPIIDYFRKLVIAEQIFPFNDHLFFSTERWERIIAEIRISGDEITGKGEIKNYDNEVDSFFAWIAPFVEMPIAYGFRPKAYGWAIKETEYMPQLWYKIKK